MSHLRIRRGTVKDEAEVCEIDKLSFPKSVTGDSGYTRRITEPDSLILVAEADGKVVGYAFGYREGMSFKLDLIAVHPAYRRTRVATRLAQSVESLAGSAGLGIIALQTSPASAPFFDSRGYVFVGAGKALSWNLVPESKGAFGQSVGSLCLMMGSDDFPLIAYLPLPLAMDANPQSKDIEGHPGNFEFLLLPNTD